MQENRIAADIEVLRERCRDTRELYREVCALLFFRYGITPTANRLYQYVRKGSMGTPAEVLAKFWQDLRERTRVRIDHPDLPDELRTATAELIGDLWSRALRSAEQTFETRSAQADAAVAQARQEAQAAQAELDTMRATLAETGLALESSRAQAGDLGRQLATIQGRLASMTELLRENIDEMRVLRVDLAASQRDVARAVGEANALRVQLALAKRRRPGKPLGGVPPAPGEEGQESLELDKAPPPA